MTRRKRMNLKKMEEGVRLLLEGMNVNLKDPHFEETPQRVAKLYAEMLTPKDNNWKVFPSKTKSMITLRGHKVFALCPHHLLPVRLLAYVSYIPKSQILGLSKLARVVEQHLTRPITQEDLGDLVANSLEENTQCQGAAVILLGRHDCMQARGVETEGDIVTSSLRGLFLHSAPAREELYQLIGPLK